MTKMCAVSDCSQPTVARNLCNKHYKRWVKHGTTDLPTLTPEERFWNKIQKTDTCWLWTGATTPAGYGQINIAGRITYAHRFAYELLIGSLTGPLETIDHDRRCPKHCVNPFPHWPNSPGLRIATQKQQTENQLGARSDNRSSGIRGVTWDKTRNMWMVQAGHNGITYHAGRFPLEQLVEAEAAAISLRNRLFSHNDADR